MISRRRQQHRSRSSGWLPCLMLPPAIVELPSQLPTTTPIESATSKTPHGGNAHHHIAAANSTVSRFTKLASKLPAAAAARRWRADISDVMSRPYYPLVVDSTDAAVSVNHAMYERLVFPFVVPPKSDERIQWLLRPENSEIEPDCFIARIDLDLSVAEILVSRKKVDFLGTKFRTIQVLRRALELSLDPRKRARRRFAEQLKEHRRKAGSETDAFLFTSIVSSDPSPPRHPQELTVAGAPIGGSICEKALIDEEQTLEQQQQRQSKHHTTAPVASLARHSSFFDAVQLRRKQPPKAIPNLLLIEYVIAAPESESTYIQDNATNPTESHSTTTSMPLLTDFEVLWTHPLFGADGNRVFASHLSRASLAQINCFDLKGFCEIECVREELQEFFKTRNLTYIDSDPFANAFYFRSTVNRAELKAWNEFSSELKQRLSECEQRLRNLQLSRDAANALQSVVAATKAVIPWEGKFTELRKQPLALLGQHPTVHRTVPSELKKKDDDDCATDSSPAASSMWPISLSSKRVGSAPSGKVFSKTSSLLARKLSFRIKNPFKTLAVRSDPSKTTDVVGTASLKEDCDGSTLRKNLHLLLQKLAANKDVVIFSYDPTRLNFKLMKDALRPSTKSKETWAELDECIPVGRLRNGHIIYIATAEALAASRGPPKHTDDSLPQIDSLVGDVHKSIASWGGATTRVLYLKNRQLQKKRSRERDKDIRSLLLWTQVSAHLHDSLECVPMELLVKKLSASNFRQRFASL